MTPVNVFEHSILEQETENSALFSIYSIVALTEKSILNRELILTELGDSQRFTPVLSCNSFHKLFWQFCFRGVEGF